MDGGRRVVEEEEGINTREWKRNERYTHTNPVAMRPPCLDRPSSSCSHIEKELRRRCLAPYEKQPTQTKEVFYKYKYTWRQAEKQKWIKRNLKFHHFIYIFFATKKGRYWTRVHFVFGLSWCLVHKFDDSKFRSSWSCLRFNVSIRPDRNGIKSLLSYY